MNSSHSQYMRGLMFLPNSHKIFYSSVQGEGLATGPLRYTSSKNRRPRGHWTQVVHVEFFVGNWRWIPGFGTEECSDMKGCIEMRTWGLHTMMLPFPTGSLFRIALGAWSERYHCGNGYGGFGCQGYLTLDGFPLLCWMLCSNMQLTLTPKILRVDEDWRGRLQQIEVPSLERLIYKNAMAFYADEETWFLGDLYIVITICLVDGCLWWWFVAGETIEESMEPKGPKHGDANCNAGTVGGGWKFFCSVH